MCIIQKRELEISAMRKTAEAFVTHSETSSKRKKDTLPHQDSPRKVKRKVTVKENVHKKASPPPRKKKNTCIPQIKKKTRYSTRAGKAKNLIIGVMI